MITIKELSEVLGVSYDRALRLAKEHDLGEKRAGVWLVGESDVAIAKYNCRTYRLANR